MIDLDVIKKPMGTGGPKGIVTKLMHSTCKVIEAPGFRGEGRGRSASEDWPDEGVLSQVFIKERLVVLSTRVKSYITKTESRHPGKVGQKRIAQYHGYMFPAYPQQGKTAIDREVVKKLPIDVTGKRSQLSGPVVDTHTGTPDDLIHADLTIEDPKSEKVEDKDVETSCQKQECADRSVLVAEITGKVAIIHESKISNAKHTWEVICCNEFMPTVCTICVPEECKVSSEKGTEVVVRFSLM